ncbi:hypothetical protein FQR65_LT18884 [Abscondita terminalis]|nr:hypothetical protein FQR65_LT18884 [Abscondita terminalis]
MTCMYPVNRNVFPEEDFLVAADTAADHEKIIEEEATSQNKENFNDTGLQNINKNNHVKTTCPKDITLMPNQKKKKNGIIITTNHNVYVNQNSGLATQQRKKNAFSTDSSDSESEISVHDSSSEEHYLRKTPKNDADCMLCNEKFSNDRGGELWVIYNVCNCWAHEALLMRKEMSNLLSHESGRADIEGSKSDIAMNAWPPQASYPCGNFSDTSCLKLLKAKSIDRPCFRSQLCLLEHRDQAPHLPYARFYVTSHKTPHLAVCLKSDRDRIISCNFDDTRRDERANDRADNADRNDLSSDAAPSRTRWLRTAAHAIP